MPHDAAGKELKVGDLVHIPCLVRSVSRTEEACNLTVETELPALGSEYKPVITLNSRQVFKVATAVCAATAFKTSGDGA